MLDGWFNGGNMDTALGLYDIDTKLEDARRIYMTYQQDESHEAIEPLIEVCKTLAAIVEKQHMQILGLDKALHNHISEVM
jgi:hypothetical protein